MNERLRTVRRATNTYTVQFAVQFCAVMYVLSAAFDGKIALTTAVIATAGLIFGMRNTVTRLIRFFNLEEKMEAGRSNAAGM